MEQIDAMFYENPRVCMGLNPENRRVVRGSKTDEEQRYREFAHAGEKKEIIANERASQDMD